MTRDIRFIDNGDHFEFHQRDFPRIYLDYIDDCPQELFCYLKDYFRNFNYNILQPYDWHVKSFRTQKRDGAKKAANDIGKAFEVVARERPDMSFYSSLEGKSIAVNDWLNSIAVTIYRSMPQKILKQYFPMVDFAFYPTGALHKDLKLFMSCLKDVPGIGYVSPNKPTVEVDGKRYIVAYPVHVIEQMGADLPFNKYSKYRSIKVQRFTSDVENHLGLGDFHGFLYGCVNFEQVDDIYDVEMKKNVPVVTCFETCVSEGWFQWNFVRHLLDCWNPKQDYYYRIGYFPVISKENYAILKTLLLPGFKKTPEYKALVESNLSPSEKRKYEDLFIDIKNNRFQWLQETGDYSFLKQMHQWVEQVITTDRVMFRRPYIDQLGLR